jgi:hypothetical protein
MADTVDAGSITVTGLNSSKPSTDLRVRIKVPGRYFSQSQTRGLNDELVGRVRSAPNNSGNLDNTAPTSGQIIFPYTPNISFDYKADYSTLHPTHSNFIQHYYTHSSVGAIAISGKFTVQNDADAGVYIATTTLLKALTKMRFGLDPDAGAPPPICRLFAFGNYMLDNIPIVISSFRIELPDNLDYYKLDTKKQTTYTGPIAVPTLSTIAISCLPVFSRKEMLTMDYKKFLQGVGVL